MVDAVGTTTYSYTTGGQLLTEAAPWASDTVTNTYSNRQRVSLAFYPVRYATPVTFRYCELSPLRDRRRAAALLSHGVNQPTGVWTNGFIYDTYDPISQIKVASSSLGRPQSRGYAYDNAWNLSYVTNTFTYSQYQVDTRNQLTNWGGVTQNYDANGSLSNQVSLDLTYTYDDEDRLTQVEYWLPNGGGGSPPPGLQGSGWETLFYYDGLGRLRQRNELTTGTLSWNTTNSVAYIYDNWRVIQERNYLHTNLPATSYTRGLDLSGVSRRTAVAGGGLEGAGGIGGLLARSSGYSSGNWTSHDYYHADANGNVTALVDSSQTVVASYVYDPFGNTLTNSGTLASANTYRFSSKEFLGNSGLYYYGYRCYAPALQRWVNRDPVEERGGINLYTFVDNAPTTRTDPVGLVLLLPGKGYGHPTPPYPLPPAPRPRPPQPGPRPPLGPPIITPRPGLCNPLFLAFCLICVPLNGSHSEWPPGQDPYAPTPPENIHCKLVGYDGANELCVYHCTGDQGSDYTLTLPVDPITLECESSFGYSPGRRH